MLRVSLLALISCFLVAVSVFADQKDLAKASQNPIGNMISLPMQNNTYFNVGPDKKSANSFQLQPVYPINFGKFNLINRMIIPFNHLESQDVTVPGSGHLGHDKVTYHSDSATGLGNITWQGFFSPAEPGKIVWGVGPVLQLPTNTDSQLGGDKWSAGPVFVALAMPGKWVIGILGYNIWDFAGDSDEESVNSLLFQYFVNYNLEKGWYLTSSPTMTADWTADSDERWTVPLGLGVGRLV